MGIPLAGPGREKEQTAALEVMLELGMPSGRRWDHALGPRKGWDVPGDSPGHGQQRIQQLWRTASKTPPVPDACHLDNV